MECWAFADGGARSASRGFAEEIARGDRQFRVKASQRRLIAPATCKYAASRTAANWRQM
jgi:hypothetical protein